MTRASTKVRGSGTGPPRRSPPVVRHHPVCARPSSLDFRSGTKTCHRRHGRPPGALIVTRVQMLSGRAEEQLRLVSVVGAAAQLDVVDSGSTAGGVGRAVMELDEPALDATPSIRPGICAAAAVP